MGMRVWVSRDERSIALQLWDAGYPKPTLRGGAFYSDGVARGFGLVYSVGGKRLGAHVPEGECIEFDMPDWVPVGKEVTCQQST